MGRPATVWTDEKIALAFSLEAQGYSTSGIADRLGVDRKALRSKMSAVRPSGKHVPPSDLDAQNAKIIEHWRAGMSAGQIGARLGMTRNAVMGRVQGLKMARNPGAGRAGPRSPKESIPKTTRYGVSLALVPTMESV